MIPNVAVRWKYTRTLLGDGNFKQDHIKMKNDFDDVSLSDGLAYMVPRKDFEVYLAHAELVKPLKKNAREKQQV